MVAAFPPGNRPGARDGESPAEVVEESQASGDRRIHLALPCGEADTQRAEQVRGAEAAGVTRLMLTVSLVAGPARTVELFGRSVLPRLARGA